MENYLKNNAYYLHIKIKNSRGLIYYFFNLTNICKNVNSFTLINTLVLGVNHYTNPQKKKDLNHYSFFYYIFN